MTEKGPVLSFGWTDRSILYRFALYRPFDDSLVLQNGDYAGGVFFPVYDIGSGQVDYIAKYSGRDSLLQLPSDTKITTVCLESTAHGLMPKSLTDIEEQATNTKSRSPASALPASVSHPFPSVAPSVTKYNPLPWFSDGIFIPLLTEMPIDTAVPENLAPGFEYATQDPTETLGFIVMPYLSIDPYYLDYTFQTVYDPGIVSLSTIIQDHLYKLGNSSVFTPYRDLSATVKVTNTSYLGTSWKGITTTLNGTVHTYAPNVESFSTPYEAGFTASSVSLSPECTFSAIHHKNIPGFPLFDVTKTGVAASINGYYGMAFPDNETTPVVQALITTYLPVVPLEISFSGAWADGISFSPAYTYQDTKCIRDFSAGVTRYIPIFSEYEDTSYQSTASNMVIGGFAELKILTLEIQTGMPTLSLYANRIGLNCGYRGAVFAVAQPEMFYVDSVYAGISISGACLSGVLAQYVLSLNGEAAYALRADRVGFSFSVGINTGR